VDELQDRPTSAETAVVDGPRRRFPFVVPAVIGVLVGAVYPLSYGLVMRELGEGRLIEFWPVFDVVYAPIDWFEMSSDFGARTVDWFRRLWSI